MGDVVILGGGFGGGACAVALMERLSSRHTVTLIDRNDVVSLCGANPFVVVGERDPQAATRSLRDLERRGIRVVIAEVESIDASARVVHAGGDAFSFDALVVALGATLDWQAVPGAAEAHGFYDPVRAVRLRDALGRFDGGRIVVAVAAPPIKCPPAPFEAAMLIDWALRRRGLREAAEIEVCIPEPAPLPIAGPEAGERMRSALDDRGIALRTGAGVAEVSDGRIIGLTDGGAIEAAVAITIPVHRPPEVVAGSGLADEGAWIRVDAGTLGTRVPGVYAIGDAVAIPVGDKMLPKAGVFAAGMGRIVAARIAAGLDGLAPPDAYEGDGACLVAFSGGEAASIGGRFLATEGPSVEFSSPSTEGMAMKTRLEDDWLRFAV